MHTPPVVATAAGQAFSPRMASEALPTPTGTECGPLTRAQLSHFQTFGYLHLKGVFSLADIRMLTQRADELVAKSTLVAGEFQPRGLAADAEPYFMEPVIDRPCVLGAVTCETSTWSTPPTTSV